jgi:hypothetical protein
MTDLHCFTSICFSGLDRARVLAETIRRYHPDWLLWLCFADREPPGFHFSVAEEPFDRIVRLDDLGIANLPAWVFGHQRDELSAAVKGAMLSHMFAAGAGKVVYLDPDIALFDTLAPVIELLDRHPIMLTPHVPAPGNHRAAFPERGIGALKGGIYDTGFIGYDTGFIGVAGTKEGRAFAEWWSERLRESSHVETPEADIGDRRWRDLIPALFPDTCILHDPGCNLAHWNIGDRQIHITPAGDIVAGDAPLRFVNFANIDTVPGLNSDERLELFELLRWYRARLARCAVDGLPENYWAFSCYEDGAPILPAHRVVFRTRDQLAMRYPDPFASGSGSYQEWCSANLHEF